MAVYSHILLAVDFTPVTDTVARQAIELCQAFKDLVDNPEPVQDPQGEEPQNETA